MNRTLRNTGIFKTRGIFRAPKNIYYGEFYSEPCVTLAYLKPCIFRIQDIVIILSSIYHEKFYSKPSVTLTYLEPWYIHNSGIF